MDSLKILLVLRAPVGGLFRHVLDLARGLIARGHRVGVVADNRTGGTRAEEVLNNLTPQLALGISRIPMPRHLGPNDARGIWHVTERIKQTGANIVHGHGAKGGAYTRLASAPKGIVRAYTPHGGSLIFDPKSLAGRLYHALERSLMSRGNLYLFESAFARDQFTSMVGMPDGLVRVVLNGVSDAEFEPITLAPDATDVAYVGEFRHIKGTDVLIDAIKLLEVQGRRVSLTLTGDGVESEALHAQVTRLGLDGQIRFAGFQPARLGFSLGRVLVIPSRGESLPYVAIEAGAAGVPMIATRVGGISEIFGPFAGNLLASENPAAMASAIANALDAPDRIAKDATTLRIHIREHFSQDALVQGVIHAYREALDYAAAH
jgi:glycosyltransferase involved in cell wall biosynthesis